MLKEPKAKAKTKGGQDKEDESGEMSREEWEAKYADLEERLLASRARDHIGSDGEGLTEESDECARFY